MPFDPFEFGLLIAIVPWTAWQLNISLLNALLLDLGLCCSFWFMPTSVIGCMI